MVEFAIIVDGTKVSTSFAGNYLELAKALRMFIQGNGYVRIAVIGAAVDYATSENIDLMKLRDLQFPAGYKPAEFIRKPDLTTKQKDLAALALFAYAMKFGPTLFQPVQDICEALGITDQFGNHMSGWESFSKDTKEGEPDVINLTEALCPTCDQNLNYATAFAAQPRAPKAGDFTLCGTCGQILRLKGIGAGLGVVAADNAALEACKEQGITGYNALISLSTAFKEVYAKRMAMKAKSQPKTESDEQ